MSVRDRARARVRVRAGGGGRSRGTPSLRGRRHCAWIPATWQLITKREKAIVSLTRWPSWSPYEGLGVDNESRSINGRGLIGGSVVLVVVVKDNLDDRDDDDGDDDSDRHEEYARPGSRGCLSVQSISPCLSEDPSGLEKHDECTLCCTEDGAEHE